jgi:hypothetical protein
MMLMGKNFSLLYGGETRLAPLYDVLSTAYYPDLAKKMAMKIGGEYESEKVLPKNFEQLADEAGLAKPMVKRRVQELAETVLSKTPDLITEHPTTKAVAALIWRNSNENIAGCWETVAALIESRPAIPFHFPSSRFLPGSCLSFSLRRGDWPVGLWAQRLGIEIQHP